MCHIDFLEQHTCMNQIKLSKSFLLFGKKINQAIIIIADFVYFQ